MLFLLRTLLDIFFLIFNLVVTSTMFCILLTNTAIFIPAVVCLERGLRWAEVNAGRGESNMSVARI